MTEGRQRYDQGCQFCWKQSIASETLGPAEMGLRVCRGCRYAITKVLGFLAQGSIIRDYQLAIRDGSVFWSARSGEIGVTPESPTALDANVGGGDEIPE